MFKIFVTDDNHLKVYNLLSVKQHLSRLNLRSATLKIHLLVISKLLTIFSNKHVICKSHHIHYNTFLCEYHQHTWNYEKLTYKNVV